ncbi:hypothetical protein MSAN_00886600 [Mycena sanguinolenta]|uniref:Uncharacterized protein n=1 Tax=Mycena sanguinolenta TaxID=230812 RepID=A0A8H6YX31_9AGAR|nr:hypothetical protein MSAN_00886600 [Mycena sanguinolenta]
MGPTTRGCWHYLLTGTCCGAGAKWKWSGTCFCVELRTKFVSSPFALALPRSARNLTAAPKSNAMDKPTDQFLPVIPDSVRGQSNMLSSPLPSAPHLSIQQSNLRRKLSGRLKVSILSDSGFERTRKMEYTLVASKEAGDPEPFAAHAIILSVNSSVAVL